MAIIFQISTPFAPCSSHCNVFNQVSGRLPAVNNSHTLRKLFAASTCFLSSHWQGGKPRFSLHLSPSPPLAVRAQSVKNSELISGVQNEFRVLRGTTKKLPHELSGMTTPAELQIWILNSQPPLPAAGSGVWRSTFFLLSFLWPPLPVYEKEVGLLNRGSRRALPRVAP